MRELLFFDLETTGPGDPDPDRDRIVEFAVMWQGDDEPWTQLVNPQEPIPEERTAVHGLADEDVADAPPFDTFAGTLQEAVENAVLTGYGIRGYDVPILDRELVEAGETGLEKDDEGAITHPEIDLLETWKRYETRELSTAARRFAGVELGDEAHSAEGDTAVLPSVLAGMAQEFDLPVSDISDGLGELVEACEPEGAVDRAGRFRRRKDGVVVFAFSKNRGKPVREELGMLDWMLDRDFPAETKAWARRFLERH